MCAPKHQESINMGVLTKFVLFGIVLFCFIFLFDCILFRSIAALVSL